jgi:HD-GYP domain-containing protein (c-di-GMP phosphodiesterase class II)
MMDSGSGKTMKLSKAKIVDVLKISEDINHIKDIDSLLDRILTEARRFTGADAGSIYLVKGDRLSFEYVQNDTLQQKDPSSNRHIYQKRELPIDSGSLAGYVALTRRPLSINDAYSLPERLPYSFNRNFDLRSDYHTGSILTVPLVTSRDIIIGVMQIINPVDTGDSPVAFSREHQLLVSYFSNHAAVAIEKAKMTREMILRMIRMAELRDPGETGAHVNRVGAASIEIYHRWALSRNTPLDKIKKTKDVLRIAAMLHDIGKIGVTDAILKKREELSESEWEQVKKHAEYGARLFENTSSEWEEMAAEVALCHHEKWDGSGYPRRLSGKKIPLAARIVALADVYDALVSKRSYKDSWDELKIREYIRDQRGRHFDPDIVDTFLSITDIIRAIREKYPI